MEVHRTTESCRKVTNMSQNVGTVKISSPVALTTTSKRGNEPFWCKYGWSTEPEAWVIKTLEIESYPLGQPKTVTFQSDFVPISINSSVSKGDGREFIIMAAIAPDDSIYRWSSKSNTYICYLCIERTSSWSSPNRKYNRSSMIFLQRSASIKRLALL